MRIGLDPGRTVADQVVASLPVQSATITERLKLVEDFDQQFRTDSDKLLSVLRSLYPKDDQYVLLVIDQFEELFTHSTETKQEKREGEAPAEPRASGSHLTRSSSPESSPSDSQQTQFVELLAAVAKSQLDRLRIVITLRADFFDRCLSVPTLKSLIENRTLLLGELSDDALRTVIEAPAFKVGAYFEKGLVARILKDVENQNGSLPLLQHALKELWEQRRFGFLTDDAYDETGGVEGALKKRANATLQNLTPDQRETAKNIFLRLTTLGEGVSDTRRRVRKTELYPEKADPRVIDEVLKGLSSQVNRLIVTNDDGTVEVTHEALIQRWDTLTKWLNENRDDKRLHDLLRDAANLWSDPKHARDPSYLWEGGRLDLAEKFNQTRSNMLTALERAFLGASVTKRERSKRIKRGLMMFGAAITAVAVVAAVFARLQYNEANVSRERADEQAARASRFAAGGVVSTAQFTWVLEPFESKRTLEDEHRLPQSQRGFPSHYLTRLVSRKSTPLFPIRGVNPASVLAVSTQPQLQIAWAESTVIEPGKLQHELQWWRKGMPDGPKLLSSTNSEPLSLSFSDNGRMLIQHNKGATPIIVKLESGDTRSTDVVPTLPPSCTACFSPTAHWLAYVDHELPTLHVVDWARNEPANLPVSIPMPAGMSAASISRVVFSADGKVVFVIAETHFYAIKIGETPDLKLVNGRFICASPDGRKIVIDPSQDPSQPGSSRQQPQLIDIVGPQPSVIGLPRVLGQQGFADLKHGAFSPNGMRLILAFNELDLPGSAAIWNVASMEPLVRIPGSISPREDFLFAAFADEATVITSSRYGWDTTEDLRDIRIWDATTGGIALPTQSEKSITALSFVPDGTLVAALIGQELVFWDAVTRQLTTPKVAGPNDTTKTSVVAQFLAFTADGTSAFDDCGNFWDIDLGGKTPVPGLPSKYSYPTMSADGRFRVFVAGDSIQFGDPTGRTPSTPIAPPGSGRPEILCMAPDGQKLACLLRTEEKGMGNRNQGEVFLRNTEGLTSWVKVPLGEGNPTAINFSANSERLAVAAIVRLQLAIKNERNEAIAAEITLWPLGSETLGDPIERTFSYRGVINSLSFSPDGLTLASASDGPGFGSADGYGGAIRLWDPVTCQLLVTLRGHTYHSTHVAFSPDSRRLVSSSGSEVLLWDATEWQSPL